MFSRNFRVILSHASISRLLPIACLARFMRAQMYFVLFMLSFWFGAKDLRKCYFDVFVRFNFLQLFTYLIWLSDFFFGVLRLLFLSALAKGFLSHKNHFMRVEMLRESRHFFRMFLKWFDSRELLGKLSLKICFYGAVGLWNILLSSFSAKENGGFVFFMGKSTGSKGLISMPELCFYVGSWAREFYEMCLTKKSFIIYFWYILSFFLEEKTNFVDFKCTSKIKLSQKLK